MKLPEPLHSLPSFMAWAVDNPVTRLRWTMQRMQDHLGVLGVAGIAVLAATLGYALMVQAPQLDSLRDERARLAAQLMRTRPLGRGGERTPAAHLTAMLSGDTSEQRLAVFETLHQSGMVVRKSVYRKDDEVKGKLDRWSMNITMQGRYSDFAQALHTFAEQPLLRIDALTMERAKIGNDTLDVDLRISLLGADS